MIEANPRLRRHVEIYQRAIVRPATGATYKVLSADVPTKHGLNLHGVLFDELHAQPNRELWEVLTTVTAARRQPLTVAITTPGYNRTSIGWEVHEYGCRVRDGTIRDPSFLPAIYTTAGDDDWTAPTTWARACPSLGSTLSVAYLEQECERARASPAYENTFRRYFCAQWVEQISRRLPMEAWQACAASVPDPELAGVPAFAGLDLGQSDDFSAFVIAFLLPDGRVALRTRYWLPVSALEAHPLRPYAQWRRTGLLVVTEGNVTDYDQVEAEVGQLCRQYAVREVAYDQRFASQLALHLPGQGVTMIDQPQGYQLNEALRKFLELVQSNKLCHGGDDILTWMASNAVVRHGQQGGIRLDKEKASEKIDGVSSLAMALSRLIRAPAEEAVSAYADGHGLFIV